ncbi:hypothetical protein [Methylobacterium sp. E-046]|uniref:hypothetical protein n=1 Tax=Methylobacterium sp. E-046 TaxID=2836576 RepID=UPI001FBA83A9|nr:hypothetical protein [Methylobacterium sp. E-046]MCJ2102784.1 hypothetical protein [Methylobacterium sp. E-046]
MSFINIPEGLRLELERLHDIACNEFERRAEAAGKGLHETMRAKIEDGLRHHLRLDGIEAALFLEPAIPTDSLGDPALLAIRETERLQYAVDLASKVPQPPGTIDPLPEQKAAFDAFYAHIDTVLVRTVPTTAAGCAARARFMASYPRDRGFSLDEGDDGGQHLRILDNIARSPALKAGTQPSRTLTEITDVWRKIETFEPEGADDAANDAFERLVDRKIAILAEAEALPATRQNIAAKALALAWDHFTNEYRASRPRGDYETSGRLALDINAAMNAAVERETDEPCLTPSLVTMLDLASATMGELQAVRDLAERIGSVAYAHAWSPRCQRRAHPSGAPDFNAAGILVQWIGDVLTAVESAAAKEAAGRTPSGQDDRESRLSMLAATTIDNGDPDEIAAFARDLLAHVEAERAGR